MSAYKRVAQSKVNFQIKVSTKDITTAEARVLSQLKKNVNIKGFRTGHAPDDMVQAQIGEAKLKFEATNDAIDRAYRSFVEGENLQIIAPPQVEILDPAADPMVIKCEVEVYPEIKLGDYTKLKVKSEKIEVTDKEIDEIITTLCAQSNTGTTVKRTAKKNDLIRVDFAGKDQKGEVIPPTKGENTTFRLGQGHYLEDLEKAFTGMKAGESKTDIAVKFPKTYHAPDMAGKTIKFDVTVHEVMEIDPQNLSEELIQSYSGKKQSLEDFRAHLKTVVSENKNKEAEQKTIGEYTKLLAGLVKGDLPQSWLDREVGTRLERLKSSPQFQQNPEAFWAAVGKDEAAISKEFATDGERDLRAFLGFSEIIKKENIELDKDEKARAHQLAHQQMGADQAHNHHGAAHDTEVQKAELNLKIDKFIRTNILTTK